MSARDAGAAVVDAAAPSDAEYTVAEAGDASDAVALAFSDGFEGDTAGQPPAGWTVVMGCNPNTEDTSVDGGGLVVGVDTSEHHAGTKSVRVVGGDSCGYYIVQTSPFASLGADLYARFWVMFSGPATENHNGFLSMATSGGYYLRLGFQDDVLAWNAEKSDATLPDMDPQGTSQSAAPTPNAWACVEFHVDAAHGFLTLWLNGQQIQGLGYQGGSTQGVDDQWARGAPSPLAPLNLGLGWLGLNDQRTVWFDDVALASARIGCD